VRTALYDAVVIGAGISGSVISKILAEKNYKVLLVDKDTPPRDKACSGVQLGYMEKLIGAKIPNRVLCSNKLDRIYLSTPSGRSIEGRIALLNYWRRDFDHWLNQLAIDAGVETRWGIELTNIKQDSTCVTANMDGEEIQTKYLIGADGLSPTAFTRRHISPDNYCKQVTGASLNYYYRGDSTIKPNTLYLYYRKNISDLMYSWLYHKDDTIVVGTSSTQNLNQYAEEFLDNVKNQFKLEGEEIGREGFSTHFKGGVNLGIKNVLLVGDAAGLLDLYRGVGMDSAALSGRICALSIIEALEKRKKAIEVYRYKMRKLVQMIETNAVKQENRYQSDNAIEKTLSPTNIAIAQTQIFLIQIWNRFCKPEKMMLLPP
jgi:flavin-dependent dehydrogenase